jgi:hypothetical protein
VRSTLPTLLALLLLGGCTGSPDASRETGPTAVPEAAPGGVPVDTPAPPGSAQPNLTVSGDTLYLSWIEQRDEAPPALRFAAYTGGAWSPPHTVVEHPDLLTNWADFPSLSVLDDGSLLAHWLLRIPGGHAYVIEVAASDDGGDSFGPPIRPHRDGKQAEHGFLSVVPRPGGRAEAVWLDGREFDGGDETMKLLSSVWDGGGFGPEVTLDEDVCTCCNTAAVAAGDGVLVAYRDHDAGEIRDISLIAGSGAAWSSPRRVHEDGWSIPGCPVNGPALVATDAAVGLVWFTAPDHDRPRVRFAWIDAEGELQSGPLELDSGAPLGRVHAVALADGSVVASWIERRQGPADEADARVLLRRVHPDGRADPPMIAGAVSPGRASGFPRLARIEDRVFVVWTEPSTPPELRLVSVGVD